MIALLAKILGLNGAVIRLAGIAALVAAVLGVVVWHVSAERSERARAVATAREEGVQAERAAWLAGVTKERQRQAEANAAARREADEAAAALAAERAEIEQALQEIHDATAKDEAHPDARPDAHTGDRICLEPDGVRRLNRLR
jgi:hypothetical protein